jgi:hypothetical protein
MSAEAVPADRLSEEDALQMACSKTVFCSQTYFSHRRLLSFSGGTRIVALMRSAEKVSFSCYGERGYAGERVE